MEMVVVLGICLIILWRVSGNTPPIRKGVGSALSALDYLACRKTTVVSEMTVQEVQSSLEAAKLQTDLREVFTKMLSHARRIDLTMMLGDHAEALGQIRELESYLERGIAVLNRPIGQDS
jgi:hypothetical protein